MNNKVYCKSCKHRGNLKDWCGYKEEFTGVKLRATYKNELNGNGQCKYYESIWYRELIKVIIKAIKLLWNNNKPKKKI